ncbi:putative class V chitinase [Paramyrothecium foliicola]|nr:putative class V chitinase [Paramyrothecium foliicola]
MHKMNMMPRFFEDVVCGRLRLGAMMRVGPISVSFFVQGLRTPLVNPPPMVGGQNSNIPIDRIINALGSVLNDQNFILTVAGLNWSKGAVIVSINYIRHPWTWQRLMNIFFNVRDELARSQDMHYLSTGIRDNLIGAWDEWFRDFLREVLVRAQRRIQGWAIAARNRMAGRNEEEVYIFLARVNTLYRLSQDLEFDLDSLP